LKGIILAITDQMSAVAEHSLVRAVTPFVVAGIIALCTWLFSSVMSLEQQVKLLNEGTVHNLEEKVDGLSSRIDAMNVTLTDLRVSLGGRDRRDRQEH